MNENLLSRVEDIITAMINGTEYTIVPQSRVEYLLLELKKIIEAGGGGGGVDPEDYDWATESDINNLFP